jgi:hypothetical protein
VRRLLIFLAAIVTAGAQAISTAPIVAAAPADDFAQRIEAANDYLADRPGVIGYVLRDRVSGAVYRNAHAEDLIWTASTIKLGIVVDLLVRERAGEFVLSAADRALMAEMLHSSDNDAADTLWSRYGGPDHSRFNRDLPQFGMTSLAPQRGFSDTYPYWGFQKSTPNDLDRLMNFTLTRLDPALSGQIVTALQHVDANQQWGVWGAGPAMAPGNKNGWSLEQGGWVINSVGFAGPGQRYTLAVMNALGSAGGYDDGVATTTRLAALLLAGRNGS